MTQKNPEVYRTEGAVNGICVDCGEETHGRNFSCLSCLKRRGVITRRRRVRIEPCLPTKELFRLNYLEQYPMLVEDTPFQGDIL